MSKEIDEFINKLDSLCWEYHIEIKPTHPVPDDEYPTISIINGDEVVKLLYVDVYEIKNAQQYYNEAYEKTYNNAYSSTVQPKLSICSEC